MTKANTETTQSFIDGLDGILVKGKKAPKLAQRILLAKIVPDPDQPRREFNKDELDELAASIRVNGVLTPIAVQPMAKDGTHMLVYGERRFRAAKLAGLSEIVSTIIDPATVNVRTVQLIENMQRADLSAEEIAAAIEVFAQEGHKGAEIAKLLGLPAARISEFRAILTMPLELRALATTVGTQTLYQLFGLYKKDGPAVTRFVETLGPSGVTRAQVDALSARLKTGPAEPKKPASSTRTETSNTPEGTRGSQERPAAPIGSVPDQPTSQGTASAGEPALRSRTATSLEEEVRTAASVSSDDRERTAAPSWIVKHGDAFGRLVTDQTGPDSKTAIVSFDNGQDVRPVPLSELTLFEIV